MKTTYEYRKKALEFAAKDGMHYDAVKCEGIYGNYEVYTPYKKEWKKNPPCIGLPQVILVNGNESKWELDINPFEIFRNCKKLPSVIFEYSYACLWGPRHRLILLSDGNLIVETWDYNFETRAKENFNEQILINSLELLKNVKKFIKEKDDIIRSFPRNVSNEWFYDGADEVIRFGRRTVKGFNILTMKVDKIKRFKDDIKPGSVEELTLNALGIVQSVFFKLKQILDKYTSGKDLWGFFWTNREINEDENK